MLQLIRRVRRDGARRPGVVRTVAMGRPRLFRAWDVGEDTFVFEVGVEKHLGNRPSVLVAAKGDLRRRGGFVMTMSTGNHAVAAMPLLDGRLWRLAHLRPEERGEALMYRVLCANVVGGRLETSQRDVPGARLYAADAWLVGAAGLPLDAVVMGDRNEATIDHYRRLGQEWRVKPLVWTMRGMQAVLTCARKRIAAGTVYYHNARGVHFLTYAEFLRLAARAESDPPGFEKALRELVAVFEGNRCSFMRMPKHRGHHEIEFFGIGRGLALEQLVPMLERLLEAMSLGRIDRAGIVARIGEITERFRALLTSPALADESSEPFVKQLYIHVTGEVYAVVGDGATPAFDDRRTPLPGATYNGGRKGTLHPGADARTEALLSNLRGLLSRGEVIEYANVYELPEEDVGEGGEARVGRGPTREVVYKTNRSPLETSLVEKRLSRAAREYGSYMLARVGALKALGVRLSDGYHLLQHRPQGGRAVVEYYIRNRCEGTPLDAVPANYFLDGDGVEDRDFVLALAAKMGDAAAQNMAMKKFDARRRSALFDVGKEIYEFDYDLASQQVVPKSVSACSVRGSFGWPCLEHTDENLAKMASFYMGHYAHALKAFQRRHQVPMAELGERFMEGFEFRTNAMAWQLSVLRDQFEAFDPNLPGRYRFAERWRFVMWALLRQQRRLPALRAQFLRKVEAEESGKVES